MFLNSKQEREAKRERMPCPRPRPIIKFRSLFSLLISISVSAFKVLRPFNPNNCKTEDKIEKMTNDEVCITHAYKKQFYTVS